MVTDSPSWLSDLGIAIPPRGQQVRFGLGELDEAGARVRTNRVRGLAEDCRRALCYQRGNVLDGSFPYLHEKRLKRTRLPEP